MNKLKETFGYALGFVLFVVLIPVIMWLCSGRPATDVNTAQLIITFVLAVAGLVLSIWAIVYMRRVGDGNPMDAFGHEVAPRTKHLMTDGPYRLSRNPMLTGIFIYLIGCCIWLIKNMIPTMVAMIPKIKPQTNLIVKSVFMHISSYSS